LGSRADISANLSREAFRERLSPGRRGGLRIACSQGSVTPEYENIGLGSIFRLTTDRLLNRKRPK
jgi:hypothetical protein